MVAIWTRAAVPTRVVLPLVVLIGLIAAAATSATPATATEPPNVTFNDVSLATTIEPDGFTRSITYVTGGHAHYSTGLAAREAFFVPLAERGATIERSSTQSEDRWVVTFHADSAADVVAWTNRALRSRGSAFEVRPDPDGSTPDTLHIVNHAECEAICLPAVGPLTDSLTVPLGWRVALDSPLLAMLDSTSGVATYPLMGSGLALVLAAPPRFDAVRTTLTFGLTGAVTWRAEFTVDDGMIGRDLAVLVPVLERTPIPGGLVSTVHDGGTVYTVRLSAPSLHEFLAEYRAWSGDVGASVTRTALPGANVIEDRYRLTVDLDVDAHLRAHMPPDGVAHAVEVPFGQRATVVAAPPDAQPELDPVAPYQVDVAGTSPSGLLIYGALIVLVIAAAALRFRRGRGGTPS